MTTWSAPVRYAEVDQQGIVFNAHYLLWCDEAMGAFCAGRGLQSFADVVRLATSTLTWNAPSRWGQRVEVEVACTRVGTSSATLGFDIRADGQLCCHVDTVYVSVGADGRPQPIDEPTRAALTA